MPVPDGELRLRFVAETDLVAGDHAAISALLRTAFPEHAEKFRVVSWYPGRPEHRLWLEKPNGAIVVHLYFERRLIGVGDREVLIAGVGGVATHPKQQGKGLGRLLMGELCRILTTKTPVEFGYLGCREEVVGFYEQVGWHRIYQKVRELDPQSGEWTVSKDPTLILPATASLADWPRDGQIDLRGVWW
ncbi:MAG: GNAT family N-acetyltransferase [Rubrobacteraceae bacterium]